MFAGWSDNFGLTNVKFANVFLSYLKKDKFFPHTPFKHLNKGGKLAGLFYQQSTRYKIALNQLLMLEHC